MDAMQQEDMGDKNREYFQEMAKEIKIKNDIAQKVLNNRLSVIRTPAEKGKTNLQYEEYQKESKKLLDFCEKMMGKREKEADSIELEQPEGVPKVREISKEKLNEKLNEIIDQPQYVRPIGENTLPPYYSREMSRYEPPNPIKQKEREDLLEKVREMTSEESKGDKVEKLVELDTDLSWDHEGLRPLPKSHKDRLNGSPKPPRIPKKRKQKGPKYVYVLQGPPGPKGQEGQPGQAGRDGRDGQDLSLTKVLEETLKAHKPNLDTTGLENSFDQFGQTIFEVLSAQQRTNQNLEEQFRRANETQEFQVEAMQDMVQANFQMKFDHMFAGVPMYDGTDPDSFDDWLYQIESLCEVSHRDVWVELMG